MHIKEGKIRVLQITSGISTEGIGTFVLNTFENIDKEKIEMSFALATEWKQHHEQRIIGQGGTVYRTAEIGKGIYGITKHFIHLVKLLRKEGPFDVVHSHMDFFNGLNLLAAFIAGVPVRISHAHLAVDQQFILLSKKLYNMAMKTFINLFATHKLGCSEKANEYMNDTKRLSRSSRVLFNGIDLSKFSIRKRGNSRSDLKIDKNKINFITIGRIDNQKNPLFIVRVIKELSLLRNDIHLYWVGTGSLDREVRQLTDEYGLTDNITFLGIRDDVAELLSVLDFMLFPSKWEGLGIVLLEAQASGVPCFISDKIPKEVNIGLCTVLSLNDNETEWARKIDHLINTNSYNNRINKEKLSEFDIKNTTKELEDIYIGV